MKTQTFGQSDWEVPRLIHGMMRLGERPEDAAEAVLRASLESGIRFFDHADIYCGGESESLFSRLLKKIGFRRADLILQSKCGISQDRSGEPVRNLGYDFSYEHIMRSVEGILRRLDTDYLDVLLLHRPDTLMEPEEVARAFDELESSGKVRHFGVSNQNPLQMELLKTAVRQPLQANQLQFGPAHADLATAGLNVNVHSDQACSRDNGVLEYCRIHRVTIQAWSPLQYGLIDGAYLDKAEAEKNEGLLRLKNALETLGEVHGVAAETLALAWILRHPAQIQPVFGSMNPERIRALAAAENVELSRAEWYDLYRAAGNFLP